MSIASDRTDRTLRESGISESAASAGRASHGSSIQSLDDRFDVLVIGAGSARAVLAVRLSEDPRRSVLLLEAGPDYPDLKTMPADLNPPDTATGVGLRPINNVGGLRLSTAVTDLHQARGRPNLTIRGDVLVLRLLVEGQWAVGVEDGCRRRHHRLLRCPGRHLPGAVPGSRPAGLAAHGAVPAQGHPPLRHSAPSDGRTRSRNRIIQ